MKLIRPSRIEGSIDAPPSKSMMQRALIASALASGESLISNPAFCADAIATMNVIEALGARVERGGEWIRVRGGGKPKGDDLDCGESGTCMRMIAPVAALQKRSFTITGSGSLMKRPVSMLEAPLRSLGAQCASEKGHPPLLIKGPIHGRKLEVDGSESSQHISGLLMALPLCEEDSELVVKRMTSGPYIEMTKHILVHFGIRIDETEAGHFRIPGRQSYKAREYEVDGDWSGAAFMLVAGAIAGEVEVRRIGSGYQGDEAIKTVLLQAGAEVSHEGRTIRVRKGKLEAFEYDATDTPDLFPPLAILACCCQGTSVIHGASRLKAKESDRAAVLVKELTGIGARIMVEGDRMEIIGGELEGGRIDPHKDHRIAMAGAVAALVSRKGVEISDEGCVSKSYPRFFHDLGSLMVER